ncbi:MAG: hypothetical protein M0026_08360 [Nocardiopsaceae bacterium]|mgnify:CR=1 FL=1|nr:hypothetical protein [Nocardiopsaceae bacterium]
MAVAERAREAERISAEAARTELMRFFAIADVAERAPEMFSSYIDAEWHRLLDTPSTRPCAGMRWATVSDTARTRARAHQHG